MPDRLAVLMGGVAALALTISGCVDNTVTESEYRLAFDQFAECMRLGVTNSSRLTIQGL